MKNPMKMLCLLMLATAPSPGLAGPSAAKLEIGESFLFDQPLKFSYRVAEYGSSKAAPKEDGCHNLVSMEPSARVDSLSFTLPWIDFLGTKEYFNRKLLELNLFSSNRYDCQWDFDRIRRELDQRVGQSYGPGDLRLILDQLSPSGTKILGRYVLKNDKFASAHLNTGEKQLVLPAEFELTQCVDVRGQSWDGATLAKSRSGADFDEAVKSGRVEQMISVMRNQNFPELSYCRFKVQRPRYARELLRDIKSFEFETGSWSVRYVLTTVQADPNKLISSREADSSHEFSGFVGNYVREKISDDPAAQQEALQAGKEFVEFIQDEYGGLLYGFIERNTAEGQRREAIKAFFENNQPRIEAWFSKINHNYGAVSLMNKVSLLSSFQGVYAQVDAIEKTVVKFPTVTLDRVVKQVSRNR